MASNACEINSICRLCLCDDKCILFPMTYIIDSSLTEEDIEQFTSLQLFGEEMTNHTICVDCANKLKQCALFRTLCLSSDVEFKRLLAMSIENKERLHTQLDTASVDASGEQFKSTIEVVIVDEGDKNSNLEFALTDQPVDKCNASGNDWSDGFERRCEQQTDSVVIKPLEDDERNGEDSRCTSLNIEEEYKKISQCKQPKGKNPVKTNPTSDPRRFYRHCEICKKDVSDLKRHVLTHAKDDRFACPYCPHKMGFRTHLKKHIKTVHRSEISIACDVCGLDFLSPITHKNHMVSQHGTGEHECKTCSKKFTHIRKLNTHVRRAHRSNRKQKRLCGICGAMVLNIRMHMRRHTQEKKHPCPHCPIEMVDRTNLIRHVQSVHLQQDVKTCNICNIGFKYHCSYRSHMLRLHGIGNSVDCTLCSRKFNTRTGLYNHMIRVHSNVRKFECETCGSTFKLRVQLENHQLVHSTERKFACNQCPKRFKFSRGRDSHQLTHTGIVFPCPHCDKTYRYKDALSMHIRQKHVATKTTDS